MNKEYVLSLDASTSEIGYCVWDKQDKKLVYANHLTLNKDENLLDKVMCFEKLINDLMVKYNFTDMVIEKAYEAMFGGGSNTNVTTMLNKVNFAYQVICYRLGIKVHVISVSDCRKYGWFGIKFPKKDDMIKPLILDLFVKEQGEKYLEKRTLTRKSKIGNKGDEVFCDWCYDIADGYTVGKAYFQLDKMGLSAEKLDEIKLDKKNKVKEKKKEKKKIIKKT